MCGEKTLLWGLKPPSIVQLQAALLRILHIVMENEDNTDKGQ